MDSSSSAAAVGSACTPFIMQRQRQRQSHVGPCPLRPLHICRRFLLHSATSVGISNCTVSSGELLVSRNSSYGSHFEDSRCHKINPAKGSNIDEFVFEVKKFFLDLKRRQASVSPYDTAWVAMVPSVDKGLHCPQFPECLSWIMDHQDSNGSWGVPELLFSKDRLCHTLASVIALKKWKIGSKFILKGLKYIQETIRNISKEDAYTPVGFEIIFPAMLEEAECLGLELPNDLPYIKYLRDQRNVILKCKDFEELDPYDASFVFVVEGVSKVIDWNKVLQHQCKDGSILSSPSATACTLMHTNNVKCLKYLEQMVQALGNGVPSIYPIDLYTGVSMIDRLQRLGLDRYFTDEITCTLEDLYRYLTKTEMHAKEQLPVSDTVCRSAAFMLLRSHGYNVSEDTIGSFAHGVDKTNETVVEVLSLYRAAQFRFPGEKILENAEIFSRNYLEQAKTIKNAELLAENIICKDLDGEVEYALKYPLYASLDRIETRKYINQYGIGDTWISKTSYKIPCISNDLFLKLAKEDYNNCQAVHQKELEDLERWYADNKFSCLKYSRQKLMQCYFSVAATLFSPDMSAARMVWTKNAVLTTLIDDFFDVGGSIEEIHIFYSTVKRWRLPGTVELPEHVLILFTALQNTVMDIARDGLAFQERDISEHLREIWVRLVNSMHIEAQWTRTKYIPSMSTYMTNAKPSMALEPIVLSSLYFVGPKLTEEMIRCPNYNMLTEHLNFCGRLLNDIQGYKREIMQGKLNSVALYIQENPEASVEDAAQHFQKIICETRQRLLREVLTPSVIPFECKQVYWKMMKILHLFYHRCDGFTSPTEMLEHIQSVIFDPVF